MLIFPLFEVWNFPQETIPVGLLSKVKASTYLCGLVSVDDLGGQGEGGAHTLAYPW